MPDGPAGALPKGSNLKISKKATALGAGLLIAGGAAFSLAAGATTASAGAITSNGEAGYYTQAPGQNFTEVHATVTPGVTAEQMGANGGIGLQLSHSLDNGNECQVAQIGLKWYQGDNGGSGGYRVYVASGLLSYVGTGFLGGTSTDACTAGGALSPAIGTTTTDGYTQQTEQYAEVLGEGTSANPASPDNADVLPGQAAFLSLQHFGWNNVKGLAQILTETPHGAGYIYSQTTSENFEHIPAGVTPFTGNYEFANAGTVFDSTVRTPATVGAATQEAYFDGLRAGVPGSHHTITENVFSKYNQQEVISTANGTAADPAVVLPSSLTWSVFKLYVGVPVGA